MPSESAAAEQIDGVRRPETFLHTVEVEIADEEYTARTQRLIDVLNKIEQTEADKASRVSDLNAELKQFRKEAVKIRSTINTRKEKRDVECYELHDERRNIVFICRLSDNKVLDERAMTLEDRMHLGKSKEEAKAAERDAGGPAGGSVSDADEDKAIERESAAAKGKGGSTGEGGKVRRIKASDAKKRKQDAKAAADKARAAADAKDAENAAAGEDNEGSDD